LTADFDLLMALWRDGQRRVEAAEPELRRTLERVVDALVAELRRRLGVTVTTAEIAAYYLAEGTDWCFQAAYEAAPQTPEAWDVATVAGAAFARFARAAVDWSGGVRKLADE
jgi:aspartate/methionine/tyrosine aminotransferase